VKTIEEDLARRDFTINAMAFDGEKIIDPYGGQEDIKRKKIRFVGNAGDRIKEDALRILRAYRFGAKFKFDIVDGDIMY
jgi:tRNA nucleotidyltransferase (CCA-adding enzyme)